MKCRWERFVFMLTTPIALFAVLVILSQYNLICHASPTQSVPQSDSPPLIPTLPHPPPPSTDSIQSIKTPSGTVKCHCQTIPEEASTADDNNPDESRTGNGKTIEIEIYKPEDGGDDTEDRQPLTKNSFTMDLGEEEDETEEIVDEPNLEDRVFSTERTTFLSFLASQLDSEPQGTTTGGNGEDDFTPLESGVHMQNHRFEPVVETTTPVNTVYKAFRSAELTDRAVMMPESGEGSSEVNENHDYLWDMGKKQEFLFLGSIIDSFKGPRKRRRRSLVGRGSPGKVSPSVVYVYPEKKRKEQEETRRKEAIMAVDSQTPAVVLGNVQKNHSVRADATTVDVGNRDGIRRRMEEAMNEAWQQYGTKGISAPPPPPPPPAVPHGLNNMFEHHFPPRPFLHIDRIFNPFQPMTSEWDKRVSIGPPPVPDRASLEPGIFSQFLARYIDFEVNNHETADIMRKVVFGVFIGFLVVGWILLGAALGLIPLKKWLAFGEMKRSDKGKEFVRRDTLSELTDKILLALEPDWLKQLEERVRGGEGRGNAISKVSAQVSCCILPDEQTKGMVECQVVKKTTGRASTFKCISDLMYNFQFGPKEDGAGEEEDNTVNFKSKANNITIDPE